MPIIILLAALAGPGADIEVRGTDLPRAVVNYRVDALSSDAGVAQLRGRVRAAADLVCRPEVDLTRHAMTKLCSRETRDDGYLQIDAARQRWAVAGGSGEARSTILLTARR